MIHLDPLCESRIEKPHPVYVPRDEAFGEIKQDSFSAGMLKALLHNLVPSIAATLSSSDISFTCFSDIDKLYSDGFILKDDEQRELGNNLFIGNKMKQVLSVGQKLLKYEIPAVIRSKYASFIPCLSVSSLNETKLRLIADACISLKPYPFILKTLFINGALFDFCRSS